MTLPDPLPENMTLKPSKGKWLALLSSSLVFVALGIFLALDGQIMGWFAGGFFALGLPLSVIQLRGTSSWLKLGAEGFEQSMLGRKMASGWEDVSDFRIWKMKRGLFTVHTGVSFDRAEDAGKRLASVNQAIAGGSAALGDTYGMKAEELADLMNAFRARALARRT